MVICSKLGVHFTVITPGELNPDETLIKRCTPLAETSGAKITVSSEISSIESADVVYTDVWTSMGEEDQKNERLRLLNPYQVNQAMMDKTGKPESIFLHCLPAVREEEVTSDVLDGRQSRAWDQAENRKHTIKAVMLVTLGK
jgi:ornithine carbamoyltransferase